MVLPEHERHQAGRTCKGVRQRAAQLVPSEAECAELRCQAYLWRQASRQRVIVGHEYKHATRVCEEGGGDASTEPSTVGGCASLALEHQNRQFWDACAKRRGDGAAELIALESHRLEFGQVKLERQWRACKEDTEERCREMHREIQREMHREMHREIQREMHGEIQREMHREMRREMHREMHGEIQRERHGEMRREIHSEIDLLADCRRARELQASSP